MKLLLPRLSFGFLALLFVVVLPVLEVGPTHLVNPTWPAHARIHEAWQLLSNACLSLACLWLAFRKGEVRWAGLLGLCLTLPFLVAVLLQGLYGGSLTHVQNGEEQKTALVAVPIMLVLSAGLIATLLRAERH